VEYYQDGHRIARMGDGDPFSAQIFNWEAREWQTKDVVGAEILCTGNFLPISKAEADRLTRVSLTA
jgi:hypothetical protein